MAYEVLLGKGVPNLTEYVFVAVDEDNFDLARKDKELGPFLVPKDGQSHGWMNIVAIPGTPGVEQQYCIYFEWDIPEGLSCLKVQEANYNSVAEITEVVRSSLESLPVIDRTPSEQNLGTWQQIEILTDDLRPIAAYIRRPKAGSDG